jgi:uncharacterized protein YjaG (DUF416 family)
MTLPSKSQSFLDQLEGELGSLPIVNQIAFAAACCERAIPNYCFFSEIEKWGDPKVLRSALDQVWSFIEGRPFAPEEAGDLEARCKALTPDSDNFSNDYTTAAQEAAFMVTLLLQWYLDRTPRYAVRIAAFARDTIDLYVQISEGLAPSDPEFERKIEAHFLMRGELAKQNADLSVLKKIRTVGELRAFRRQASVGKSNIGLENDEGPASA